MSQEQSERQMVIGYGISVEGRIENCERLILDGNLSADQAQIGTLVISETGSFKGKGIVAEAEIGGRFQGDLLVDGHISILSTGRVEGKVTYASIEIKPGGKFTGEIILREPEPPKQETALPGHFEPESPGFEPPDPEDDDASGDYIDRALQNRITPRPDLR